MVPQTGRFAKRVVFDVVGSLTVGTAAAYAWWHYSHVPKFVEWREFDKIAKIEMDKLNAPYYESLKQDN